MPGAMHKSKPFDEKVHEGDFGMLLDDDHCEL